MLIRGAIPIDSLTEVKVKINSTDGLKYVWIPAATFMMGCSPGDSECYGPQQPAHEVTISRGFWMGQTAVTVGAYKRYAQSANKGAAELRTHAMASWTT